MAIAVFNESFLCGDITDEEYPDVVASSFCVAIELIKKYKEMCKGDDTNEDDFKDIKGLYNIKDDWYLSYCFNNDKVQKGINSLNKRVQDQVIA